MPVTNVKSTWSGGNLVFTDNSGNALLAIRSDGWVVYGSHDVAVGNGGGAPTDGTSGTGAGIAGPGSIYHDYTGAKLYINTNTKASPLWTPVGAQTT